MAINLPDLPLAVEQYLLHKIAVSVSDLNPVPETLAFTFRVSVQNASVTDGGIALTNVRYQVGVDRSTPFDVKVVVPNAGASVDDHGEPLDAMPLS